MKTKTLIVSLYLLLLLFSVSARADDVPFFAPLRAEIVSQLTTVSNTTPFDKRLNSSLTASLKLVDKTKPTFITGASALGTLAKSLGKTSLSNTFLPIVVDTRDTYLDAIGSEKSELELRLADTIPGKAQAAAQTALNKLDAALEATETNLNLTLSLKSLSTTVKALAAAEKAVAKAEVAKPGPNFISATITETGQPVTTLKPLKNTLEAYYDYFDGSIAIEVGEIVRLAGGRVQTRFLGITAVMPDDGANSLSLTNDNEGYAVYQRIESPSLAEFEEEEPEFDFIETFYTIDPINEALGTGTLSITVDFEANIVWGTFNFTASGSENTQLETAVTGSFLVRLSTYDDFE